MGELETDSVPANLRMIGLAISMRTISSIQPGMRMVFPGRVCGLTFHGLSQQLPADL